MRWSAKRCGDSTPSDKQTSLGPGRVSRRSRASQASLRPRGRSPLATLGTVESSSDFEIPEGSIAAGRRVKLPSGAEQPITVYINGVEQSEGEAYAIEGREIVFSRPIIKEGKLGTLRWLTMLIGVVGSYKKHETVDVSYRRGGGTELASDVEVIADRL